MRSLVFLGSKASGLRICRRLLEMLPSGTMAAILSPDDRADGRSEMASFERLAADNSIPFHIASTRAATVDLLREYNPRTAIVHGWYQIIPTVELPEIQFLGFHYSPLPRYRGNAPLVWQLLNGESEIGVSFFELVPEMDAGRLYRQACAPLHVDDTVADALHRANDLAEGMLDAFVEDWLADNVQLTSQPEEQASYCALRLPDDGLIDWRQPGDRLHDFVRAQTRPYPGAFTTLPDGRRLTIWKSAREPRQFMGVPGGVAEIGAHHVVVAGATGAVRLLEVEVECEGPAPAATILRSLKLRLGGQR